MYAVDGWACNTDGRGLCDRHKLYHGDANGYTYPSHAPHEVRPNLPRMIAVLVVYVGGVAFAMRGVCLGVGGRLETRRIFRQLFQDNPNRRFYIRTKGAKHQTEERQAHLMQVLAAMGWSADDAQGVLGKGRDICVCWLHFFRSDLEVAEDGRVSLKPGALPRSPDEMYGARAPPAPRTTAPDRRAARVEECASLAMVDDVTPAVVIDQLKMLNAAQSARIGDLQ
jgi:hypothetical protein